MKLTFTAGSFGFYLALFSPYSPETDKYLPNAMRVLWRNKVWRFGSSGRAEGLA